MVKHKQKYKVRKCKISFLVLNYSLYNYNLYNIHNLIIRAKLISGISLYMRKRQRILRFVYKYFLIIYSRRKYYWCPRKAK